ncbi:MAG: 4'-phosphopantetheinyl transferase family protein, partial [Persicimonas sp.]
DDAVDVWRVGHSFNADLQIRLEGVLTEDERERAERFAIERPRTEFVVTRALLRCLVRLYLPADTPAADSSPFQFETFAHGKPRLVTPAADASDPPLRFNVSHADGLTLLAFTAKRPVGVDVEDARRDPENLANVARYFAPEERATLDSLAGSNHREAFFRCWTRKEAYLKATGRGMSVELDSFAVSVDPDDARLVRDDGGDASAWSLTDLDPGEGFAGALCVRAQELPRVTTRHLDAEAVEALAAGALKPE